MICASQSVRENNIPISSLWGCWPARNILPLSSWMGACPGSGASWNHAPRTNDPMICASMPWTWGCQSVRDNTTTISSLWGYWPVRNMLPPSCCIRACLGPKAASQREVCCNPCDAWNYAPWTTNPMLCSSTPWTRGCQTARSRSP